ncbi:MAG: hypothetical protein JOS17DRAFT_832663 [Linnemannia elongata]|nr:MAG: hypothetical protein JOS17DRAFT_832663 [Linnemannia elongata]
MGLFGWFPFIRKKGYSPNVLHNSDLPSLTTGTRHFDVLANCFLVIRNAYANLPQEAAHRVLEKEIERFGTKDNLRLYIDGPQAKEKQNTAEARETTRERALERVEVCLNTFESRLNENMRIRKRHHTDIKAGLASSFYWSHTSRTLFAEYLTTRGWTVLICTTEADLSIAQSIQANDVVISKDSDMLAYGSVVTLWRPVSNNVILEYKLPDLLRTLSFTRAQLTALAVVSRNDYHRNIYSLGPASNFGIIKKIENSEDPRVIVVAYLSDSQVIARNTQFSTFEFSIRVFVDYQQTPVSSPNLDPPSQAAFQERRQRYEELCIRSSSRAQQTVDRQPRDTFVRLDAHPRQPFNRYRTVESPVFVSNAAATPAPTLATPSAAPDPDGHPALARTRIPRNRGRHSFKTRARKISHPAPPMSKQFKLKFYQERPETVNNPTPAKKTTSKANKPPRPDKTPIADKDKKGLLRSLSWHHPIAWLETGTLEANVGRVLGDGTTLRNPETPLNLNIVQQEVVECIQEAVQSAANVKRNAQRLIGEFVETLAVRMRAAEETKRTELQKVSPSMAMTNVDSRKARRDAVTEDEREILTHLCVCLKPSNTDKEQQDVEQKEEEDNTDLDDKGKLEQQFLQSSWHISIPETTRGKQGWVSL